MATMTMTEVKALQDRLAAAEAENAALKAAKSTGRLTCKVSTKGAVSLYGLGRFPVTLYAGQWERLFGGAADIAKFIEANRAALATKPEAGIVVEG